MALPSENLLFHSSLSGGGDSLLFPIRQNADNEIRKDIPSSALFLENPSNIKDSVVYDPVTKRYVVMTLIGGKYHYTRPYSVSLSEYVETLSKRSLLEYNRQQLKDGNKYDFKNLVSQIQFLDKILNPIFGVNKVKINVQGSVELTMGVKTNKIDNPTLPIDMRKTTSLDFDEDIQFNITGNISDLITLDWNYNTNATFDFENMLKLSYEGKEDDIVKKVEAGNVSLPLAGTLISGGQNLWGFKTELQFGKLTMTSIFSQQKGESKVIQLEKGGQKKEFEVSALSYEANRHFFLSQYFRNTYDAALKNLPVINSGVTITKVEVWVTNKSSKFDKARNIVAFLDLGESAGNISNTTFNPLGGVYPDNGRNDLYQQMNTTYADIRDINKVTATMGRVPGMKGGTDYEKLENARLLDPSEYTLNDKLGYVSLNQALNGDEVLAVAYEYTVRGEVFSVGELTSNALAAPSSLIVKMLRSTTQTPANKFAWNLMMKNIYSIGAFNLSPDDFVLDILYQNDRAGTKVNYLPAGDINNKILLSVLNLDNLNSQLDAKPDGRFDYVEGVTVYSGKGRIVFPVIEPFGSYLKGKINNDGIAGQYIFDDLYEKTQSQAEQNAEKNKFYLKGSYKSSNSSEISLDGGDIPQGSVKVLAGGVELVENIDYTVDYTMGMVNIINQALLEAGTPITIKSESRSSYGMQTKTLVGTHLNYQFNEKFNIGGTVMHMSEKPLTHKVNIGEEPISNTIWGLNASYNTESGLLTTLVDKLPFINTNVESRLNIETEFAKFTPGTSKGAGGNAYIDDFEGSKISIDLKAVSQWKLASTPQDELFPEGKSDDYMYGYNRAKLAWYVVDPIFYRMSNATPGHIRADKEQRSNHFVREIKQTELYPDRDLAVGDINVLPALSLAFYPNEKGPYNFDLEPSNVSAGISRDGKLNKPESRWGGIMRSLQTNDFEAANVQYIEIWVMDPFVYDVNNKHKGGDVYIDLGDVSEDILKDGRKSFENGLPTSFNATNVDSTKWGRVPKVQSVVNGFDNNNQARRFQDVGLDGLSSEDERSYFTDFLNRLRTMFGTASSIYQNAFNDPANDDYHYFRGSDYDAQQLSVLERYKRFNNAEGNSPTAEMSPESYPTAATTLPDVEDINGDNTLNETEAFFRYHLSLRPEDMEVGKNFISNIQTAKVDLPNGKSEEVKWYQIKIPISAYATTYGGVSDFKSVRFMRILMKGFQDSVIMRMASVNLVRDNWRKYDLPIDDKLAASDNTVFDVSVVNLEENSSKTPVNYVMPPGISRVVDATNPQLRELNEQAMLLKVLDLEEGDSRGVYKNVNLDMLRYKTLLMDVHAEAVEAEMLDDDELTAFIRIGSDNVNNYYEYEVPLKLTPKGVYMSDDAGRLAVWPLQNRMAIPLEFFQSLKQIRNSDARSAGKEVDYSAVYEKLADEFQDNYRPEMSGHVVRVKGKPTLSTIRSIMIGIRNPKRDNGKGVRSAEIWVNELRLSDFDNKGGWAGNLRVTAKLADVATLSFAASKMTPGFGSIEQHVSEIRRDDFTSFDFSSSVEFGKFFPETEKWRLRIPMYYAYSRQSTLPEYDPLDTDIPLELAIKNAKNRQMRDSIKRNAEDYLMRKSLNFTNIGMERKDGKTHFFDLANLSLTYSYNKNFIRNVNVERDLNKSYRGLISYIYNGMPKNVEPFKNVKAFNKKSLQLLKDFNFYFMPSMLSVTSDITRDYREILTKNLDNPDLLIEPTYDKDFMWRRDYSFKFNLTQNLTVDFRATTQARIDEPEGIVDKDRDRERYEQWKDTVINNILDGGRPVNYNHDFTVNYRVPINKLPGLDWTSLQAMYAARYDWQAAALTKDSTNLGNVIRNANSLQLSGDLSLTSLYNKSRFLREISRPARPKPGKQVTFEQELEDVKKGKKFKLNHNLKTGDVKVKLLDPEGKEIKIAYVSAGKNRVKITSGQKLDIAKVVVTGRENNYVSPMTSISRFFMGIVTGVKNVNIGYSEDRGSTLPGFLPEARWLGQQGYNGSSAPGFRFLFGGQNEKFGVRAAEQGWLTDDTTLNSPYLMNYTQRVEVRALFEPIKNLRINLSANRTKADNSSEYILFDPASSAFGSANKVFSGNFSMTMVGLNSAFFKVGNNSDYSVGVYQKFLDNRRTVSADLAQKRYGGGYKNFELKDGSGKGTGYYDGYGETSQEVLISSFNQAYGVGEFNGLIPGLLAMRPNWRVTYTGLKDIGLMKKLFNTFTLNHTYTCKYNVGSYSSNIRYEENADGLAMVRDMQNNWMAMFDVSAVSVNEYFNPLIGVDMEWSNRITSRFEIRRQRDISLSLVNAQLAESASHEIVVGAGYRFASLPIFFKDKKLDNDINLQCDFSVKKNNTIIRRISEEVDQLTAGQQVMSLKVSADYTFNNRLNLRLFYDRQVNNPYVSLSYPTTTSNFGMSVRYTLTQ